MLAFIFLAFSLGESLAQGSNALPPNTPGGDTILSSTEIYYRAENGVTNLSQLDSMARVYAHKNPSDTRFSKNTNVVCLKNAPDK